MRRGNGAESSCRGLRFVRNDSEGAGGTDNTSRSSALTPTKKQARHLMLIAVPRVFDSETRCDHCAYTISEGDARAPSNNRAEDRASAIATERLQLRERKASHGVRRAEQRAD